MVQWLRLCGSPAGGRDLISGWRLPCSSDGEPGFDPWVGKCLWRREWQSSPVFLPGEFHGQRSLAGYSPWSCKELDMTEQLTHTHTEPRSCILLPPPQKKLVSSEKEAENKLAGYFNNSVNDKDLRWWKWHFEEGMDLSTIYYFTFFPILLK